MQEITKPATREIVSDFADEIRRAALGTAVPSRTIINFRTDWHDKKERDIVRVPIDLLRYRKDNGRIASDVLDYEKHVGILHERNAEAQNLLRDFLDDQFALQTIVHGAMVDVYGIGILIVGRSGIGKSEVALDLVERGHRLVADDVVMLTKKRSV